METEIIIKDQVRLKYIKDKFVISNTECSCCGNNIRFKKMWIVQRWGINKRVFNWYYCHNCMSTKEEVLNEIDTDAIMFGIYPIDDFKTYKKKDNTKIEERFPDYFVKLPKFDKTHNDKQEEQIPQENCVCQYNGECKYKRKVLIKNN